MGHMPEYSAQCLIGKCPACPDPDCEHECHPPPRTPELEELQLWELDASETAKLDGS